MMTGKTGASAALALALSLSATGHAEQTTRIDTTPDGSVLVLVHPRPAADAAQAYLDRIAALDDAGPQLNAVIVTNPEAPLLAAAAAGIHPLEGRTVLVKDNIETREWPTTAGSLALAGNMTGRDASLIARLRAAGGVVLGKTNLSEWANIRSTRSTSGWSAIGGLTKNPHAIDRNACGSSSGSGAAVAAGFAWAAIGTETDGSITCPASVNGVVGFKPSVGLVSQAHIVPISSSQDTAGPMARTVYDAALLLTAIAGPEPGPSDREGVDYTAGLAQASLAGKRVGVLRSAVGNDGKVAALFEAALEDMRRAGAETLELDYTIPDQLGEAEYTVLLFELRATLDAYLEGSPADIPVRSLDEVIAYNAASPEELRWFGQEHFLRAAGTSDAEAYRAARARSVQLAATEGIDRLLAQNRLDLLVAPTTGPAWTTDLVNGDNYNGSVGAGTLAAVAGYPHLTVPMGTVEGLPVGLSFMASKGADLLVLQAGASYERARSATLGEPSFARWKASATD